MVPMIYTLMSYERIENTVTVSHKLADLLRDPTAGLDHEAKKAMSAEARKEARDGAYDDLMTCIDTLAAAGHFHDGYLEVINIAQRIHVELPAADESTEAHGTGTPAAPT